MHKISMLKVISNTEIGKHEIEKQEGKFLPPLLAALLAALVQPEISSVEEELVGVFSSAPSFKEYQDY